VTNGPAIRLEQVLVSVATAYKVQLSKSTDEEVGIRLAVHNAASYGSMMRPMASQVIMSERIAVVLWAVKEVCSCSGDKHSKGILLLYIIKDRSMALYLNKFWRWIISDSNVGVRACHEGKLVPKSPPDLQTFGRTVITSLLVLKFSTSNLNESIGKHVFSSHMPRCRTPTKRNALG
jgi:hypothetical protein